MSIRLNVVSGVPLLLVLRSSEVPPILEERWVIAQDRGTRHKNSVPFVRHGHYRGPLAADSFSFPLYPSRDYISRGRMERRGVPPHAKDSALAPISHFWRKGGKECRGGAHMEHRVDRHKHTII